jgi:hypothetical protein
MGALCLRRRAKVPKVRAFLEFVARAFGNAVRGRRSLRRLVDIDDARPTSRLVVQPQGLRVARNSKRLAQLEQQILVGADKANEGP